ncbi:MAG: ABC transporter substrate-binding protein [Devosia sp. 67-54]|uniref:extracellular solute-binding protein n=1 Tax=unclassified Devosia TaxID=196773 RepID=UPI0009592B6D|nr:MULTISPECIES: extracellular solute-binding protein [unclassified Devosia]MBN9303806.1 extracellular solute-binding protein [Devosia sp.]OJX17670.1 MAG: ABC transporter substrate-binding protein [Devosia sp. 67-54]
MHDTLSNRLRLGAAGIAVAALAAGLGGAAQAQTLVTWDDYTDVGQNAVIEQLNKNFEAAHPGVTINRTARTFDDLSMTLKLTVAAGNGPQVTKVNQGAADQGTMVKQKLLLPIDDYVKQYGWDKRFGEGVLARMQWSDSGQFGEGHYYGVSGLGEMVGLFYNQKVLSDAGISTPPKTFEELLADADALHAKGVPAFAIGTAKQHIALHMLTGMEQAHIDASNRKALDDVIYGRGGTFKTQAALDAATTMQKWAKEGYFIDGYSGIAGNDAVQLFVAGQGAFLLDGTWYFGDMQANPDIHFMPVPAPAGVSKPLTVGGVDLSWSITSNAKDKATQDLAAQYMDYMVSPEAANVWAAAGFFPSSTPTDDSAVKSPLLKEGLAMWKTITENNALGHYADWASPTMLKTYDDNMPHLLAGDMTPQAFVDALDADYQAYMKSVGK